MVSDMAKDELKKNKKKKGKDKVKDKEKKAAKKALKAAKESKESKATKESKVAKESEDSLEPKSLEVVKAAKGTRTTTKVSGTKKYDFVLSMSLEDYIEQIYVLDTEGKKVRVTDMAKELGLSKPSVNRAINNLVDMGYVEHDTYGGIGLTKKGKDLAKHIHSKHMALETYLIEVVGVPIDRAVKEAKDASHYLSGDTIKKISEL